MNIHDSAANQTSRLVPEMALTESISSRLSDILGNAQSTAARLATVRDRTFGCPPPHVVDPANKASSNNCRADEISMLLSAVYSAVSEAESLAAELQSRL